MIYTTSIELRTLCGCKRTATAPTGARYLNVPLSLPIIAVAVSESARIAKDPETGLARKPNSYRLRKFVRVDSLRGANNEPVFVEESESVPAVEIVSEGA